MTATTPDPASATERAKKLFGSAARLAQKQAELTTLDTVTFPKLYHAIGKYLMSVEKLPADLEQRRTAIRELMNQNTEPGHEEAESSPGQASEGIAAKAAQFAQKAARKVAKATGDAARTAQIQAGYVALGKAAVEKYGEKAVPAGVRDEYRAAMERRGVLSAECDALAESSGGWVSRRNLAIVGLGSLFIGVAIWQSTAWVRAASSSKTEGQGYSKAFTAYAPAEDKRSVSGESLRKSSNTTQPVVRRADHSPPVIPVTSPNAQVFSDRQWADIVQQIKKKGWARQPQEAARFFDLFRQLKAVFIDHDIPEPTTRMLFGLIKTLNLPIEQLPLDKITEHLRQLLRAGYENGMVVANRQQLLDLDR